MYRSRKRLARAVTGLLPAVIGVLLAAAAVSPAGAIDEFHAYLIPALPDTVYGVKGTIVDVPFWVDASARQFNAYVLRVRFDRALLRPDSVAPVLEGALFTGLCPNRWWDYDVAGDSIVVTHSLLCAGVSANGPGTLCHLRLHADSVGVSALDLYGAPDRTFYDAGLYVWPQHPTYPRQVILHPAVVKVYDPTISAPLPLQEKGLGLRVLPNPVRGACRLECVLPAPANAILHLTGADGRQLGSWPATPLSAGPNELRWSGCDAAGRPLASGVYFLRLEAGGESVSHRVLVLR